MQLSNKKNELSRGLKTNKKLRNSFYYFIYEKHIDWAIILSVFLLLLPYIASKNWYFLLPKAIVFLIVSYQIGKYLLSWHSLHEYSKVQNKFKEQMKKLIDSKRNAEATEVLHKLSVEIQNLPDKAEKKKDMYKDFMEYLKYDKIDFIPIEDILNEDKEVTKTSIGLILSTMTSLVVLREIPKVEYKNYKRILFILFLTVIFFVIYTVEFWLAK
jgi:hypothetical protein